VGEADVEALRGHGLSDAGIHDAIQVVSFFNYINRIAEGVGIHSEPEWRERPASDGAG
jgi:alkylhydroperoxidase family enzyme